MAQLGTWGSVVLLVWEFPCTERTSEGKVQEHMRINSIGPKGRSAPKRWSKIMGYPLSCSPSQLEKIGTMGSFREELSSDSWLSQERAL